LHGRHHYAALDQLHEMPRWHDAVQLLAAAEGDLADRELELG
jgi:hypothetical protein